MRDAGLEELETYIVSSQNTVLHYILTRPIMDLCLEAEKCPGGGWINVGGIRRG